MLPYLSIGESRLSTYWMMFFVGVIAMLLLTLRRRKLYGISILGSILFTLLTSVLGLAGAKLLYILENLHITLEDGVTLGGMSFFGSVYLVPLLMIPCGMLFRLKPKQALDAVAPCVVAMVGCIRIGCFFNGCCGGWEAHIGTLAFHWPTQAMESICDFMLLYLLLLLERRRSYEGWLYPVFLAVYGIYRFLLEFLRDTPKDWLALSHGQWFSLLAIGAGLLALTAIIRKAAQTSQINIQST